MMELYKERGVNPFSTFPTLIVQMIILIGLYAGLRKVIDQPKDIVDFAYPALQHLGWIHHLSQHIKDFDNTLFGVVDLTRSAFGAKGTYVPALIIVLGSALVQFMTSKQLMPTDKNARRLRDILKQAGEGTQADQSEVNAAVGRSTMYIIPLMVFIFTVNLPSALGLYWLVGGLVMYIQQSIALRDDEADMEKLAEDKPVKDVSKITEAEIVPRPHKPKTKKTSKKSAKKRRR